MLYKLLWKTRTTSKIREFELTYHQNSSRRQKDYCSSVQNLDKRRLCDYYVCSSRNPQLTGFLNYDYSSNTYLGKIINYGCRYIELDIFSKDVRVDREPVVSSGDKVYQGQNVIPCEEVFHLLKRTVFSRDRVDNYRDPFFIYLNLKTDNVNVMNRLYEIIKGTISDVILTDSFGINVGNMRMCELMDKIVLFASSNIMESKLKEVVTLVPGETNYIKRIEYSELPTDKTLDTEDRTIPFVTINSDSIKLSGKQITFLDNTNPLLYNVQSGMKISFNDYEKITIENVSNDTIEVDQTYDFGNKTINEMTNFSIYKPVFTNKDIIEFNKNGLTIVYFGNNFFPQNKDPENAWLLGCQFLAINFQKIDFEGMKYINSFYDDSFLLKPSNLRRTIKEEEDFGYGKQMLGNTNIKWDKVLDNTLVDFSQFTLRSVKKLNKKPLFARVTDGTIQLGDEKNKSVFVLQSGSQPKTVKITYQNAPHKVYLTVPEKCCYPVFLKLSEDSTDSDFYPVKSTDIKGNISFMFVKDNEKYYLSQRSISEIKSSDNDDSRKLYLDRLAGKNGFFAKKVDLDQQQTPDFKLSPEIFQKPTDPKFSLQIVNTQTDKCLALKNGYWSNEENKELILGECRDNYTPNEFIYNNARIRSKYLPDLCLERGDDEEGQDFQSAILSKCNRNIGEQDIEYYDQKITNDDFILSNEKNKIVFKSESPSTWAINQEGIRVLKSENTVGYVLAKVPRMVEVFNGGDIKPILNEYYSLFKNNFIDDSFFHIWIKCDIRKDSDNNYFAKPVDSGEKEKNVNSSTIVVDTSSSNINVGDKVLVKNGTYLNFNEKNIWWEATVTKLLENNKVKVIMGPNSIEPDLNRYSAKRPRVVQQLTFFKSDCIPLIPAMKEPYRK